jgi:hypothetical protein
MRGLLVDNNIQGQMENVRTIFLGPEWGEIWASTGFEFLQFADVGIDRSTKDDVIWQTCRLHGLLLVTANRNAEGPDSLGAMLESDLRDTDLPVVTIADQEALRLDKSYARRVAIRILEICWDIEKLRGTGRIFVP